jgi:hypothetical protein
MGHWLMDTAGIGSIIVLIVGFSVLAAYVFMLRWIQTAAPDPASVGVGTQEEDIEAAEPGGEEP